MRLSPRRPLGRREHDDFHVWGAAYCIFPRVLSASPEMLGELWPLEVACVQARAVTHDQVTGESCIVCDPGASASCGPATRRVI
eukprot:4735046-Prymnesium_polylepis.1